MRDLANLLVSSLVVFGASVALALGAGLLWKRWRRPFVPEPNAKMRVRTGSAVYRCRFVGETSGGWAFSAPLQRDAYVPMEVGQTVSCEVTTTAGVMIFETRVRGRRADPVTGAAILLSPPRQVRALDRREDERRPVEGRSEVTVDGNVGTLVDLSSSGAKIRIRRAPAKGASVRVLLPSGERREAFVIDSETAAGSAIVRVRFEDAA